MKKLATLTMTLAFVLFSLADGASARGRSGGRRPSPSFGGSRSLSRPQIPQRSPSSIARSAPSRPSLPQNLGSRSRSSSRLSGSALGSSGLKRPATSSLPTNRSITPPRSSSLRNSLPSLSFKGYTPGGSGQLRSTLGSRDLTSAKANAPRVSNRLNSDHNLSDARDRLTTSPSLRAQGQQRRSDLQDGRSNSSQALQDRKAELKDRSEQVRSRMQDQLQRLESIPFTPAWYSNHPLAECLCADLAPAAWAAAAAWVGAAAQPLAYDYGAPGYDSAAYESAAEAPYEEPASVAASDAAEPQWLALGVYALMQPEQSESSMLIQLFVNHSGTISGTYLYIPTDNTRPVEGYVDAGSQRATWKIPSNSRFTFECGLHELTQDELLVVVRSNDGTTQLWTMVRLPESNN